jgi:hypothetical protein
MDSRNSVIKSPVKRTWVVAVRLGKAENLMHHMIGSWGQMFMQELQTAALITPHILRCIGCSEGYVCRSNTQDE